MTSFSISITNTVDDIIAWNNYTWQKGINPMTRQFKLPFLFAGIFYIMFFMSDFIRFIILKEPFDFSRFIFIGLILIIGMIVLRFWLILPLIFFARKSLDEPENAEFFKPHKYTFSENGLTISESESSPSFKYSEFDDLLETDDYFFFQLNTVCALVAPKNQINDEQIDSIRGLKTVIKNS